MVSIIVLALDSVLGGKNFCSEVVLLGCVSRSLDGRGKSGIIMHPSRVSVRDRSRLGLGYFG